MEKSFVMQLASLVTLFVSLPAFVTLVFGIINLQFPDAADSYWQVTSAEDSIRYSIAVVAIFFPSYLVLTRLVNRARRNEGQLYHTLTRWLVYLALLVAGVVILTDLAVVVYTFLGGEITTRFILKALALMVVIGAAFYYYAQDAKNYWQKREQTSVMIGAAALAVVLLAIGFGVTMISSPSEARESKLDQQQISDLQDIQWRIEAFYQTNTSFPANLETLYAGLSIPTAPNDRDDYHYSVTGADTFVLCATFANETPESERRAPKQFSIAENTYLQNQNWDHPAGEHCFERRVTTTQDQVLTD